MVEKYTLEDFSNAMVNRDYDRALLIATELYFHIGKDMLPADALPYVRALKVAVLGVYEAKCNSKIDVPIDGTSGKYKTMCSFCGNSFKLDRELSISLGQAILGPNVSICRNCVELAYFRLFKN